MAPGEWFGVRCVFSDGNVGVYEERITIWRARDFAEAIALAEAEAVEYAAVLDGVNCLDLAQAYLIGDEPGHGGEVFSLVRNSALGPEKYLSTFFDTGAERQGEAS